MVQYPDCPFCGNATSALSIVDVEINGIMLKGIQCNSCTKYIGFYFDHSKELKEIMDRIDDIENSFND